MCGFAGFVDITGQTNKETLINMRDALQHRGPDDEGIELFRQDNFSLGFGFRRLSIIDLSPAGHQPMFSDDGSICIMLNGEIYNYREIKKDLIESGYTFKSNSDTEVVIQAYRKWGIRCIDKFIGMFAIAMYDKNIQQFFLIRDRAGVKPLYCYHHENLFLFASELKAFHAHPHFKKEIDKGALSLYFQHGYIPAPHCIFEHTFKLLPGHFLQYNLTTQKFVLEKYWDVTDAYNQTVLTIDYKEAKEQTEALMKSAFQYRMVADVPVGVFLSGGYDSTAVTALLQAQSSSKIKTFTIGFKEKQFDESGHARAVANHLGTDHHELICSVNDAKEVIPMLADLYDEPFADSSGIPTYLVSKMARQQVTVALSADAGDETFAGYTKYDKCLRYIKKLNLIGSITGKTTSIAVAMLQAMLPVSSLSKPDRLEKLKLLLRTKNAVEAFNIITQAMTQAEVNRLLVQQPTFPFTAFDAGADLTNAELLNSFLWCDYKTYLADDILTKVDRATMAVSLEGREPLLDHRLIEWAAQLPAEYKLKNGNGKVILKDIVHDYVPKEIMERPKMGFNIPYQEWFRGDLKSFMHQLLDEKKLLHDYFKIDELKKMILRFELNLNSDFQRLWSIINFQLWFNRWMK